MTIVNATMPLAQVALLALGEDPPAIRDVARTVLRDLVDSSRDTHADVLEALDGGRYGTWLPFELEGDEQLVAAALMIDVRGMDGAGCAIFSRLTRIDAGALLVPAHGAFSYLDDVAPDLGKLTSWFYPSARERYLEQVEELGKMTPCAQLKVGRRLVIEVPVSRVTASLLDGNEINVALVGEEFLSVAADRFSSADVSVSVGSRTVCLQFSRPEAVLRLSAAAELGRWLKLEAGEKFRAFVRLRPLHASQDLGMLASATELERLYLHVNADRTVGVPPELWVGAWASGRFRASSLTATAMRHWQQGGHLPP